MPKTRTEGRSWILLRGLARDARHWGTFLDEFRRRFPEDEIECLDIAGNGDQSSRPSFLTIAENVEDLRSRSKLLRAGRPVWIFAISMGGMLAMDWTARHPDEIAGLAMINTSGRPFSRFFERLRPRNYPVFASLIATGGSREKIERAVLKMTTHLLPDLARTAHEQSRWEHTSVANFARQLWAAARFRVPRKPAKPILLLASRHDDLVNPACTRRLAQAWNLPWTEHETAGHDLPLDAPEWVAEQVGAWANRNL